MAWSRGKERPLRLKLTNGTASRVSVYLDQCDGHTRLGVVEPGRTRRMRLPPRLIAYHDQLRLHLFDLETLDPAGIYAVDVEDKWELELAVDAETPSIRMAHSDERTTPGRVEGGAGFMTYPGEDLSYATRWAEDTPAALTWQCSGGEAQVTLTHQGPGGETQPVSLAFGEEGEPEASEWKVLEGRSLSLQAPPGMVSEITGRALGAAILEATVGEGEQRMRHRFELTGLTEALTYLSCFPSPGGHS